MDISQIKNRLNQLQNQTSTKDNFWKPEPGKTQIRIVPYKHNKDNPFLELYFHYNLGKNKTYLSPVSFGRPDPVNEFADKLKSTGDKDEWIQGKRLELVINMVKLQLELNQIKLQLLKIKIYFKNFLIINLI